MDEIHFYSNKKGNLFLFIIYTLICTFFIYFYTDLQTDNLFRTIILHILFIAFLFNTVRLFILLIRKKPLFTISNQQIFIYNVLTKAVDVVNFKDISEFTLTTASKHRTEKINIVLKNYNSSSEFPVTDKFVLTQYLNVKANDLLKILNDKLKNV